MLVVMEVQR